MQQKQQLIGRVLCKGSGLKVFCEITLSRKTGNEEEYKRFRYNLGSLQKIVASINRQTAFNYVAGRSTPAGVLKGIRNSYGEITFESMDASVLYNMFYDIKKFNYETEQLESSDLEGYYFDDYSLAEKDAAVLSGANNDININLYKNEIVALDDLPPIDIIVTGYADQIDPITGVYESGNTYQFKLKKVVFLSETFGISPGTPLHNVATKVLILGGIEPWKKIENNNGIVGE